MENPFQTKSENSSEMFMDDAIQEILLDKLPKNKDLAGPEPDKKFIESIEKFGVIYPIILHETDNGPIIIDGIRRVKAARQLKHQSIKAISYFGVPLLDRTAWTAILNQHRSVNIMTEYQTYSELVKSHDWEELRKLYGFNKNHVEKILSLGKIKDLDIFCKAYQKGKIANTTLFAIAKLSNERQTYLKELLSVNGKLSMNDVKEAKKAKRDEAVASMPKFDSIDDIPALGDMPAIMFAVALQGSMEANLYMTIDEAIKARDETKNSRLYRLLEI